MMDYILTASRRNLAYGTMLLEDIEDARMCDQSGTLVNHPAWIVGHIVGSYDVIAKLLGLPEAMPKEWAGLFGWGKGPVADRSLYPSKAELVAAFAGQHERIAAALAAASPETLARPIENEMMRKFAPRVGDAAVGLATCHEAIHLGQLSAWRVAMGMPLKA